MHKKHLIDFGLSDGALESTRRRVPPADCNTALLDSAFCHSLSTRPCGERCAERVRGRSSGKGRLALAAVILGCVCLLGLPTHAEKAPVKNSGTPSAESLTDVIEKAHDEAVKEGKTSVSVDLTEDRVHVQEGDLVKVNYTATDEAGKVIGTTIAGVFKDPNRPKAQWLEEPATFEPEDAVAGSPASPLPLGDMILGMAPSEKKTVTLPPDKAYGASDPRKVSVYPVSRDMPKVVRLSAQDYTARFFSFPKAGQDVNVVPYFKSRITEITDTDVALESLARDGERVEESFGTAEIHVSEDKVTVTLIPRLGSVFKMHNREGRITEASSSNFTVDFNHPMAGKKVNVEVELLSLTKASQFRDIEIPWIEDHDTGIAAVKKDGKPAVVVLYADWCSWSQRLLHETFEDPRLKLVKDQYVWMKIDSEKQSRLQKLYGQNGFPLIVLLDGQGNVVKKLDGFRNAGALRAELALIPTQHHARR